MSSIRLNYFLDSVADAGMELLRGRIYSNRGRRKSAAKLCHELLSTLGEASGTAIARDIVDRFSAMGEAERLAFFIALKEQFDVDRKSLLSAAKNFCDQKDDASLAELARLVESERLELFRRINMAPGGTRTIVEMRRQVLRLSKDHPELRAIDADLKHLLSSWFNRGFLEMERIDWETPAIILEKLIENESVHEMQGWNDLRGRLAADRRCFAFFHRALPNEPLIFVEVALVNGLSESISPIIDDQREISNPFKADTAIFYSINNCLEGLQGISFGNFLIKQVVQDLSQEFPNLKRYATLSPIPGFCKWLKSALNDPQKHAISRSQVNTLAALDSNAWLKDPELVKSLKPLLLRLAAHYFINVKRKIRPLDPVARFHLRNGAKLERVNWLGDCSRNGMRQSAGMLANYVYSPDTIVENHERYVKDNVLAVSRDVIDLIPRRLRKT